MFEAICINDNYTKGQLEFWSKYNVKFPLEGKIYTISEVVVHTNGKTGVRCAELVNAPVPVKHSVLGTAMIVPTFKISRFATLQGNTIIKEMLENVDVNV